MGSSGGGSQTTTMEPWGDAKGRLRELLGDANTLYQGGGFSADPYTGNRVALPSNATTQAQSMIANMARSGGALNEQAQSTIGNMMSPDWQSDQLEAAQQNALGAAIPAAVSQFAGSGMANSTQAMDTVARAATEATAPYAYDAMQQAQQQGLKAAALSPSISQAGYLPGQMLSQVGAQQEAQRQAEIDAAMQQYYEGQNQAAENLGNYANLATMIGGMGSSTSVPTNEPSTGQQIAGAGLGGLGAYGMLAANPVTAPFAVAGGLGAGLLGLL